MEALSKFKYGVLLLFLGAIFLLLGLFNVDSIAPWKVTYLEHHRWLPFILGLFLLLGSLVAATYGAFPKLFDRLAQKSYVSTSNSAYEITIGTARINVHLGRIDELGPLESNHLVVLPANEFFDDACITDGRSALGAFALKHFAAHMRELRTSIDQKLVGKATHPVEVDGVSKTSYGVGSSVYMDRPFGLTYNLLLVSVTTHRQDEGLRGSVSNVVRAIEETHCVKANKRLDTVWMPLIGAGHGGLAPSATLLALLIGWADIVKSKRGRVVVNLIVYRKNEKEPPAIEDKEIRRLMNTVASTYQ